jgi:hypothetical protein
MLRAHRQPPEAQRRQLLANRALVQGHAEHRLDLPLQVDAAPPHYPVPLRIGARLHQGGELGLLLRRQPRWPARRAAVDEPRESLKRL